MEAEQHLGEAVTNLYSITENLDGLTEGPLDDLGTRYNMVLLAMGELKTMRDALELALIESMPENTMSINGVTVMRERKTRSSWKPSGSKRMRDDIKHNVASALATDLETGEVNVGRRNLLENAIDELYGIIPAFSSMKVEGRERYGLTMSEYREYQDGWNITVVDNTGEGPNE